MSQIIHKSHNVSILLYHFVCPTKYRKSTITAEVDAELIKICQEISDCYEIDFLEIGTDKNHVHFLVQSVPTYSPTKIIRTIKSITARDLKYRLPSLHKALRQAPFWSSGYFVDTVGRYTTETVVRNYVANQGNDYHCLLTRQLDLFTTSGDSFLDD
jgi:putative transposase